MKRPLEPSERSVACPRCQAPAGKLCVYSFEGRQEISLLAHVERKRASGRAWRIATIADVIKAHQVIGAAPDPIALAEAIEIALHVPKTTRLAATKLKP